MKTILIFVLSFLAIPFFLFGMVLSAQAAAGDSLSYVATIDGSGVPSEYLLPKNTTKIIQPWGVHIDNQGRIYFADGYNHRLHIFDQDRKYISTIGSGEEKREAVGGYGVYVDAQNRVFVEGSDHFQVFDDQGKYLFTIGWMCYAYECWWGGSEQNAKIKEAMAVIADSRGYIHTFEKGGKVRIFNGATFVPEYDGYIQRPTFIKTLEIGGPISDVFIDSQDRIYVAKWGEEAGDGKSRIEIYNPDYGLISTLGRREQAPFDEAFIGHQAVTIGPDGKIYVIDRKDAEWSQSPPLVLIVYDQDFNVLGHYDIPVTDCSDSLGEYCSPEKDKVNFVRSMAVDAEGKIYLADFNLDRVQVYSLSSLPSSQPSPPPPSISPAPAEPSKVEITQEGQIAFVQYKDILFADPNIWLINSDGSNAHQFTTDDDSSSPCWLKDGRLVFGRAHKKHPSYGSAGFPTEIWASKTDRSEEQLILKTDSYIRHIDCSPTELEIAYSQADPDGGWDIYLKEMDKEAVQLTSQPKRNNDSPSFSSNSQKILFSAQIQQDPYRSPVETILEMNLDGSGEKVLVHDPLERYTGPQMSPKGDKIVFYCLGLESFSVGGGHWLMLANADGSESKLFFFGGVDPGWSPDGKSIIFSTGDVIKMKNVTSEADSQTLIEKPLVQDPVWQLSSAGGQQPNVPSPPATTSPNLGVSPDELEKMFAESTTNAPEDFMHHWQITNVTYFKGNVFRGEKMDWYIMLDSQDPQYELPVGKKVYVFFDLYDFKDTAKGLVSMIDAEGEVIEKVDVGDSSKVPRETVIKLSDVAMYPAYWPDELQTTLMFYVEGQGNVSLEHKREINVEANPDIEANCAYAMIDTGLALMFPEAFLAFKEVKGQYDFLLELRECNKDLQKNIQDQNYEALGQEAACNAALLTQDAPVVSDILEILDTLKQLLDCKTVFTEYLPDYLSGILADLAQKGISLDALIVRSPAEAVVTLADGKRLGVDNGQVVNDLGDGGGVSVGHPTVILFKGVQPFTLNLTGLEKGAFGLTLLQARSEGKLARFDYNKVKTAPHTIASLEVKPDGNPEKDFQLAIDKNNDGKIDSYKKPDKFKWAGATAPKAKQMNFFLIWGLSIFGLIVVLGGILFILWKRNILGKIVQRVKSLFSAKS